MNILKPKVPIIIKTIKISLYNVSFMLQMSVIFKRFGQSFVQSETQMYRVKGNKPKKAISYIIN
jgi:hypothetical protein